MGEGGFIEDEGGFPTDDERGGFLPDDDEDRSIGKDASPGMSDDEPEINASKRIPLYALPSILAALGLPNDDGVLSVFKASASGWDLEDPVTRRRKRDDEDDLGVERKDFRAVCAALMGPDEGAKDGSVGSEEEEDIYQAPSDEESSLSSILESDYDGGPGKSRLKRTCSPKTRTRTDTKRSRKALEEISATKLSTRQREVVRDIWDMLKPKAKEGVRGANILGREEVKHWVRTLGETWTEDEVSSLIFVKLELMSKISEMVALFSSQHEQRGLSFEDFGNVMARAGLV